MPFADYESFEDCVRKNSDKNDSEAYCAVIKRQTEGKLADYDEEELTSMKERLGLNGYEFIKMLTLLEDKADASDLSVGDWVMINIGNESTLGRISGEGKESRTEEGNTIDGEDDAEDVFRVDVWDSEEEQLDESVIHPASRLSPQDAPDGFSDKAEIPDKYEDELGKDRFVPPETAQDNAQQALDWREEHGDEVDAMTETGWRRANQLASGEALTPDTVDRMSQFRRHEDNASVDEEHEGEPWKDNGRVAWLGWGGETGVSWAESLADRMDEIDEE